jgi:hypothetical protein
MEDGPSIIRPDIRHREATPRLACGERPRQRRLKLLAGARPQRAAAASAEPRNAVGARQ